MLNGTKKLAVFYDVVRPNKAIPEEIVPENQFAPHVRTRTIICQEDTIHAAKTGDLMHYICFSLPGEEWRAATFFWIKRATLGGLRPGDIHDDIIIGRLLGYSEQEIASFTLL